MKHSKLISICLLAMTVTATFAAETLSIVFDKPQELTIGTNVLKIDGNFQDGGLAFGAGGIAIPAGKLLGSSGTVIFKFKVLDFKEPALVMRTLLTLRTKSRLTIGLYTSSDRPSLNFSFTGGAENYIFRNKEKIQFNQVYTVAYTFNGEKFCVYIDGKLIEETKQLLPVEKLGNLNIGNYKDGWFAPKPWADDCIAYSLKTYDTALTPMEVAAASGVALQTLQQQYPAKLTVPKLTGAQPELDGDLKDQAWNTAASMPGVINGNNPEKSGALPPHAFFLTYDRDNLYLGFNNILPDTNIIQGSLRTADKEPEVWGDESFEFYIVGKDKVLYRFAGNVAGGSTETKGLDNSWIGPWQYASSLKVRIDNRQIWQGEVSIPWSTIGFNAPPMDEELQFNFCRTWRLSDLSTHSSLINSGSYSKTELFPIMALTPADAVFHVVDQSDPSEPDFQQKIAFNATANMQAIYQVALLKDDNTAAPLILSERKIELKKGEKIEEEFKLPITSSSYNRLMTTLSSKDRIITRQIRPFKLNENFLAVKPEFLKEKVIFTPRLEMLKNKFSSNEKFTLTVKNPQGEIVFTKLLDQTMISMPFAREMMPGVYKVQISTSAYEVAFNTSFNYPGIGDWEKITFDNRIIPPFTPLQSVTDQDSFKVSMFGRTYQWSKGSIFPTQITTKSLNLLTAPVSLQIDGKTIPGGEVLPGKQQDHRAEFVTTLDNAEYKITDQSWIEYDGVQYNQVSFKAHKAVNNLKLKIALNPVVVKYLHTSDPSGWWNKLTEKINNTTRSFRYYPVVWIGSEDKGLCFFAESKHSWKTMEKLVYKLVKSDDEAFLEVTLADKLSPGDELNFEFGLLATPVRPLPQNYPLNSFGANHTVALNRPNHAPVNYISMVHTWPNDLNSVFADLPSIEKSPTLATFIKEEKNVHRFGGKMAPYNNSGFVSDEYPEIIAYKDDWKIIPEVTLTYENDGKKHFLYSLCPTTGGNAFSMTKFKQFFTLFKSDASYFDFAIVARCNNNSHGCFERTPLLGQREFYRRVALLQLDAGFPEPLLLLHNTDSVQLPAMTFATHLLNGEQIRQASSTMLHNNKDILDNYGIEMFASELNTLPFGLTNSVYLPIYKLLPKFGGTDEDEELYSFRMTKAVMAGALVHNTTPALVRGHYGIFDKIFRVYEEFNVPEARFIGYWTEPASVTGGKNIYVSVYRHKDQKRALAVIGHIGKEKEKQNFEIAFDTGILGFSPSKATEVMTKDDPEYAELFELAKTHKVPIFRAQLKLGDFGSKIDSISSGKLRMSLDSHSFSIIELSE